MNKSSKIFAAITIGLAIYGLFDIVFAVRDAIVGR